MSKISEAGRTMLEMLGVLAVVGVLSAGGLGIVSKTLNTQKITKLLSDTSDLARYARKMACQYDTGYSSYNVFLYNNKAYPADFTYDKSNDRFEGVLDAKYKVIGNNTGITITITGLSEESCLKLSTNNWGYLNSSGLTSIAVGAYITGTASGDYPMTIDKVSSYCNGNNNTIIMKYSGCH